MNALAAAPLELLSGLTRGLIGPCLALSCSTLVLAQQTMYVCDSGGHIFTVRDYATAPTLERFGPELPNFWADLAVRPVSGNILLVDVFTPGDNTYEVDALTGQVVGGCSSFGSQSGILETDRHGELIGIGVPNGYVLHERPNMGVCVDVPGIQTNVDNNRGLALTRDGSILALHDGNTTIRRVDGVSGMTTSSTDFGLRFEGIEVDTDGSIYGLTSDGELYRVTLQPPSAQRIGSFPVVPNQAVPSWPVTWTGIAFRIPAPPIDEQRICQGVANSSGTFGRLVAGDPAGTNLTHLGFRAEGLPVGQFAFLMAGTGVANINHGSGTLCIATGHVSLPVAMRSDASGTARFAVDTGAFPNHGSLQPGDSFLFQVVYRDLDPQPTWNYTSAIQLTIL